MYTYEQTQINGDISNVSPFNKFFSILRYLLFISSLWWFTKGILFLKKAKIACIAVRLPMLARVYSLTTRLRSHVVEFTSNECVHSKHCLSRTCINFQRNSIAKNVSTYKQKLNKEYKLFLVVKIKILKKRTNVN